MQEQDRIIKINIEEEMKSSYISRTEEIISYLPFLMIGGVFSGLAVGIIARISYRYVERIYKKV